MPSPLREMDASRIAARERRVGLLAGAALTVVAIGVLAFAIVAWTHAPAEGKRASAGPVLTPAAQTQAPAAAVPTGNGADARDVPTPSRRRGESGDAARGSRTSAADRVPMTADSASRFMPLYRRAAAAFGVNWRLIASIHQQETSFSSARGTYRGLNFARCCAGPMQFNVKNGPVSTWERFRDAYRRAPRPASYPHPTRRHPSVYDDFDAVMAAGALLRANGAGPSLDGSAWLASYHYYGHDFTGLQYADQVLARAVGWAQRGLCVMCGVDPQLAARFDAAFAAPYRAELLAAERRARAAARAKARAKRGARERARRARAAERRAARLEAKRRARARAAAAKKAEAAAKKAESAETASRSEAGDGASEQAARTATAATTTTKPSSPSQTTAP